MLRVLVRLMGEVEQEFDVFEDLVGGFALVFY